MFLIPYIAVFVGIIGLISLRRGAIFVPIRKLAIDRAIRLLEIKSGEMAVDLGSGDGRVVIALARAGAQAHGYEHNPLLVWWSRFKIRQAGLSGKAIIHMSNFWTADLSNFTVFTVFGIGYIMKSLEEKLLREAKSGSRIISYTFKFPTLKPFHQIGGTTLYLT